MKLIIKGKPTYIKRMYKHLRKEHPSTKRRMKLWKKIVNQKDNEWWQIGKNKQNKLWLPEKWIHLGKDYSGGYEVRADKRINNETIYGHSKFFKDKFSARKFVNKYMNMKQPKFGSIKSALRN